MTVLPQYQGDYYTLQRQQALAQALAQQAMTPQQIQPTGSGQYTVMPKYNIGAGVAQLGQALLAAKLGNQVSEGMQNLGQNQWSAFGGGAPQATQGQQPTPQGTTPNPFSGDQGGAAAGSTQADSPQPSPMAGNATPMNPLGMNPALAYMGYSADPGKYFETQAQAYKPADISNQIRAAGIDPASPLGRQLAQTALANSLAPQMESLRPGGYAMNRTTGEVQQMPQVPEGFTAIKGEDHQWHIVPVDGATGAMTSSAAANAIGKAYGSVGTGYQNGQPVYVNNGVIASQTAAGGQPAAPGASQVNPGRFGGYQSPGGTVAPALAPGVSGAAEKVSGANADRYNQAVQFGVDSPTRQNVLDNIIQLSQSGVQTGPGSDWQNNVKGMIANTPGLNKVFPNWQGSVGDYQELKKYLNQNGLRAWQAAGGTGTDSQMDAAMHANPNDTMFPQALQTMAAWAKAGELAGTARANFYQQYKQNNGGVSNLDQADQTWRNNFDPKVFQLQTYSPAQRTALLNSLTPTQAQQLMQKRAWFKQNGLLQ
jgi:hypothetical protein